MTIKLKAVPHVIEAFRFDGPDVKPPKWFLDAVTKGEAAVTINHKISYIDLYKPYQLIKAFPGDYIAKDTTGEIVILTGAQVSNNFEEV